MFYRSECRVEELGEPTREVKPHVLVDQERHPRRRHHSDDARNQAAIEAANAFFPPRHPDHASEALAKLLVGLVDLQPASEDLVRVRDSAGDELRGRGDDDGGLSGHAPVVDAHPLAARKVEALGRLVHGELHGAVRHANHGDAQAAVQAADALGGVDCPEAGPHGRVGALCALVRGQHARLDDPDGVRQDRRGGAAEGAGDEVVGGGGALGAAGQGEGVLEAGFEEEEGGPAEGVAGEVRDEAAVERGEGVGAVCEGSQHGDGGEVVRGGAGGTCADWRHVVSMSFL